MDFKRAGKDTKVKATKHHKQLHHKAIYRVKTPQNPTGNKPKTIGC
jgi:hypothetical protein